MCTVCVVPSKALSTPSNMTVQGGSTFDISFEYYAVPAPSFTWYINDELYKTVDGTRSHDTHTMMFTNASQSGWYRCLLENKFGSVNYTSYVDFGIVICDHILLVINCIITARVARKLIP